MQHFSCAIQSFPCTYLGLPLHFRQPGRVQVQPLIDKMANRLPVWKGKYLNRAGRLKLVNSVLSSLPTYFLTIFPIKKRTIKKMDRIRGSFFWKGSENANGEHCLMRWTQVRKPKQLGGLGVLDFERFIRALRLRWLWLQWMERNRLWVGFDVPCDENDKQLFRDSTLVMVGDGKTASFWESPWLDGKAPRDIAPHLFLLAWRKKNTVAEDLHNQNWTRGLWRMSTAEEMAELVVLWDRLQNVQLTDLPDSI